LCSFYNAIKAAVAQGVSGAKEVYNDLRARFPRVKRKNEKQAVWNEGVMPSTEKIPAPKVNHDNASGDSLFQNPDFLPEIFLSCCRIDAQIGRLY
jgi:hypothetical protein